MSPFMKGALGFLGCAGIVGAAYAIGKKVGREETLKEVEQEEKKIANSVPNSPIKKETTNREESASAEEQPVQENTEEPVSRETATERVRNKRRGIKGKLFDGAAMVKDLLGGNADDKKLTVMIEDGDVVARLSQKGA